MKMIKKTISKPVEIERLKPLKNIVISMNPYIANEKYLYCFVWSMLKLKRLGFKM